METTLHRTEDTIHDNEDINETLDGKNYIEMSDTEFLNTVKLFELLAAK